MYIYNCSYNLYSIVDISIIWLCIYIHIYTIMVCNYIWFMKKIVYKRFTTIVWLNLNFGEQSQSKTWLWLWAMIMILDYTTKSLSDILLWIINSFEVYNHEHYSRVFEWIILPKYWIMIVDSNLYWWIRCDYHR